MQHGIVTYSHLFPENMPRAPAGKSWCKASTPHLNHMRQLPGNKVKMLGGMKAAGRRLGRSHLLKLMVSGPRSHQNSNQGTWDERLKHHPRNGGRCTDGHRDFPFSSWEELSAETQMWLKSCELNSSKQFLEAWSTSFRLRFRHLVILSLSTLWEQIRGSSQLFYVSYRANKPILWAFKRSRASFLKAVTMQAFWCAQRCRLLQKVSENSGDKVLDSTTSFLC